jgi:nitroreductase
MTPLSRLLNRHRSIRAFRPDAIAPALIESVCADAIAGGSSSGNLNSVSIVVTQDEARKERLYELHFKQDMVRQAPLVITFCADWFRTRQWLASRSARDNFNNLLGYHVAAFDAMIVAQNVCLGFEAHGLGICYMGTTLHSMGEIADFLELPETCLPVTTIVVGIPAEDPPKRDRLPLNAFIHHETYSSPSPAELDAIYRDREIKGWERYMSMPHLKALVEEHNIKNLAEFYTSKVKYDPDVFAIDSEKLRAVLERKRFIP